ncbi:MAG TPA: hypothetical protein PKV48_03710 [Thermodesulfobacteriota bacterium]|nr:hypothetical protein [Thermodesulfobacteriota bacterium]
MAKNIFQMMAERWPSAVVARTEIGSFTGGIVSEKYLANLDCQGRGPMGRFRIGRKIVYPVSSVLEWLEKRAEKVGND